MKKKKWIFLPEKSENIIEQLLYNRHVLKKDWANFIEPDFENGLHDPFLLEGMSEAVERLKTAIINKEIVGIFGDYDADGIPASALLSNLFEAHGLKNVIYIPLREEGYGLNEKGIDYLKSLGVSVLITVDLGIREIENTKYARSLGMDVIITDHHEPGENIPDTFAVINPKRKNSPYPFRELSGGGVAFKLAQAMSERLKVVKKNDLKWMLDLVGITTICDVVPLIDENRIFAKFGLLVLEKTKRPGLVSLYKAAEINNKNITTYTVGYQIGPRLNAPGRLNQNQESLELLLAKDKEKAEFLAGELNDINKKRQNDLEKIYIEARTQVVDKKLNYKKVILVSSKNWSSGLIGLVAGRLTEEFVRPAIVLDYGKEFSKGSARSIDNFNIVEVLEDCKDLLESFGGHAKAAGLTLKNENINFLYERLLSIADKKLTIEDLIPKIKIDKVLEISDLSFKLIDELKKLEPYGLGNSRPVFVVKNIATEGIRCIGIGGKHMKFSIGMVDVIAFNMGTVATEITNKKIDIAFTLDENIWNDEKKIQMKVVDIKLSE